MAHGFFVPEHMPSLRVLKARNHEMDDETAILLFDVFRNTLWSLDLSGNKLTDNIVAPLRRCSFAPLAMWSDEHFSTEGKLTWASEDGAGSDEYGRFGFIEESECSATFAHPNRMLADPPVYSSLAQRPAVEGWTPWRFVFIRSDGRSPIRRDTAEDIQRALAGTAAGRPPMCGTSPTSVTGASALPTSP